jgi:FKBP-type peptidyl-prolyl cis-trans isomerase FkpA
MNRLSSLLSLCLLLVTAACGTDSGDPTKVTYAPALGVDLGAMTRTASGLYLQDQQVGTGAEATSGRYVEVHYSGWLPNGDLFDTSRDTNKPIAFTLGQGRVIQGWEEGLVGMKVGGKRRLIIPPALGYGDRDLGDIPPNSVLVFDVELVIAR